MPQYRAFSGDQTAFFRRVEYLTQTLFQFKFAHKSNRANVVFSFKFAYNLFTYVCSSGAASSKAKVAGMLLLASSARNSASELRLTGIRRPASWALMACVAAGRGTVVAKVDEDPWLGRLARRLLPSRRCRCPLCSH
jgi:hypothetical protein